MLYAMKKFTAQVGGTSAAQRSWVDLHVPSGTRVGALALSMGAGPSYVPIWRDTEFFNTSVELDVYFGKPGDLPLPLGSEAVELSIQPTSGLLSATVSGQPRPVPRYLLLPLQGTNSLGLAGTAVAESPFLPLTLLKLATPARIDWATTGTTEEGFLAPDVPATATIYNRAAREVPDPCATFSLIPPAGLTGTFTVTLGGRVVSRGGLAGQRVNLAIGLGALRGPTTPLAVTATGHNSGSAVPTLGTKLAFFTIATCPAQHS